MINKELYCFSSDVCGSLAKENASTTNRGIFGGAWGRHNDNVMSVIITSHEKERNSFMGCYE
jgi:hypothetical protein